MNPPKKLFIFIGPPGSGKGSLAQYCMERFGWKQLSTGNLCRKHIVEQTAIGKEIDFAIKSGKLIPDELIIQLVDEWFSVHGSLTSEVILDGYPRTLAQAILFEKYVALQPATQLAIIRLIVSDAQIVTRLSQRIICKNNDCQAVYSSLEPKLAPKKSMVCDHCGTELYRRADDHAETVRERLSVYHKHEGPLLDFFAQAGYPIIECDGEKPLYEIFSEFAENLGFVAV